ncbi:MAG: glycoside hydrolase family 3 C-terminal domain-containing protein [Micrococcales bacterium]|nr:glycoside hydrolase family 3 C-terminal domain-containing protein [Micrococcales bacterium]
MPDQHTDPRLERPWQDPALAPGARIAALVERMTLSEKAAQLVGLWVGASANGAGVAPHQHDMGENIDLDEQLSRGLGQLTRAFGTAPVDAAEGAASLARAQRHIADGNRFGIPAMVHEECLAGFTAWGATAYPVPLSWGATFDPALVQRMAFRIGEQMRALGVHQGLAPVLDVTRDPRWGRTEETIGEDPYLVGTIGTAYVRGLESAGIVATLKHFAGYSASRGARNLAGVAMGPREFADVILPPFEMAVREGGVRSVMHSYAEVDGVPAAADEGLLTGLLRETWDFDGTVVADYFGIAFLKLLHGIAATWGDAARLALRAGVDVELPSPKTYAAPLVDEVESGRLDELWVDIALERVLRQKLELGLLEPDWSPLPAGWDEADAAVGAPVRGRVDLDPPADRALARELAESAVVLLRNDGTLPLDGTGRIAVLGPSADAGILHLGCYSFPSHVGVHHPELPLGIALPSVLDALAAEFPCAVLDRVAGCTIDGSEGDGSPDGAAPDGGIADAVAAARAADVAILVLGDRAGLFGEGTSGEGCDAESLRLPGAQAELLEAVLHTGTPTVLVLIAGRPYALGSAPQRAGAIVQTFFPGEEGGPAISGVLSGRVNPSGRLPVSIPRRPEAPPFTYLLPALSYPSQVSNVDPTPAYLFGSGLGYSAFSWSELTIDGSPAAETVPVATDGAVTVAATVRNTGERDGVEVVQLYLHDPVASVVRPVQRLVSYARVPLAAGASARVEFRVPADAASFTGVEGTGLGAERIVEPGELELRLGASASEIRLTARVHLTGPVRRLDHRRRLHCEVRVH